MTASSRGSVPYQEFLHRSKTPTRPVKSGSWRCRHDPLDAGDAVGLEEGGSAGEEARAGGILLVAEDLGTGEVGVVVGDRVDVVVTQASEGSGSFTPAVGAMAATSGDLAELLDVDMDHVAGPAVFVAAAAGSGGADDLAGQGVAGGQRRYLVAAEDPADGAGGNAGVLRQGVRSGPQGEAGFEDTAFDSRGSAGGPAARTAAAVLQPAPALGAIPVHSPMGALAGDADFL